MATFTSFSNLYLLCLAIMALNRFLIVCSVLFPPKTPTRRDQRLPSSTTYAKIAVSSQTVQFPFTFEWSRWFSHLSRHTLGDLNKALSVSMNKLREISFHLSPNSLHQTPSTCIQLSLPDCSQQHGLLFPIPAQLLRAAHHHQPMKLQKIGVLLEKHLGKSCEVMVVLHEEGRYFEALPVAFEVTMKRHEPREKPLLRLVPRIRPRTQFGRVYMPASGKGYLFTMRQQVWSAFSGSIFYSRKALSCNLVSWYSRIWQNRESLETRSTTCANTPIPSSIYIIIMLESRPNPCLGIRLSLIRCDLVDWLVVG